LALQFLTIISVVPGLRATPVEFRSSLSFYPLVGLIVGALLAGFDWACKGLWRPEITAVLDVALLAAITRGLHLDGLADAADGLAGGLEPKRILEIMKDSRIGPFGALAIMLTLSLKGVSIASLSTHSNWEILVTAPCLSRWALNVLGASSRYARPEGGLGNNCVGPETSSTLILAGATALATSAILLGLYGAMLFGAVIAWSLTVAAWFRKRLGGVTGDILGAHLEISETLILLFSAGILT